MAEITQLNNSASAADHLREEYDRQSALFDAQPTIVQRFLEAQASQVANSFFERQYNLHFSLPDRVSLSNTTEPLVVTPSSREQRVGKISDFVSRRNVHETLRQRFAELNKSSDKAVAVSAELIRFATANTMVRNMLPSGRRVTYLPANDDDIPSIPGGDVIAEPEVGHHLQYGCHRRGRPGRGRSWHSPGSLCSGSASLLSAAMDRLRQSR